MFFYLLCHSLSLFRKVSKSFWPTNVIRPTIIVYIALAKKIRIRWSTLSLTIFFVSTTTFVNCYDLLLPLRASLHFVKILQKNDAGCYFPSPSPKCSKLFPFETSPCLPLLPSTTLLCLMPSFILLYMLRC